MPARKEQQRLESLDALIRDLVRQVVEEMAENPVAGLTPLLRAKDVAKLLRVGRSTMNRALAAGTFVPKPFLTHPYRWRRADVVAYLNRK